MAIVITAVGQEVVLPEVSSRVVDGVLHSLAPYYLIAVPRYCTESMCTANASKVQNNVNDKSCVNVRTQCCNLPCHTRS